MQASIIAECNLRANQEPLFGLLFAIPNGGHRNKATAGRLKAEGVKAGVPDLFLAVPRLATPYHDAFHGLFIELKVAGNSPTAQQEKWLQALDEQGYCTCVVRDADQAMHVLEWYLFKEPIGPGETRG